MNKNIIGLFSLRINHFLGIWERVFNPEFNYGEIAIIKSQASGLYELRRAMNKNKMNLHKQFINYFPEATRMVNSRDGVSRIRDSLRLELKTQFLPLVRGRLGGGLLAKFFKEFGYVA